MFDDRRKHVDIFRQELKTLVEDFTIESYEVHHVIQDPLLEKYINREVEYELVESLVDKCNARVGSALRVDAENSMNVYAKETANARKISDDLKTSTSCPDVANLQYLQKRRVSASKFRDILEMVDEVQHTAIVLDEKSREKLLREFPAPKFDMFSSENNNSDHDRLSFAPEFWTTHAKFMLISNGTTKEETINALGGIGATVKLRVVATGLLPGKVFAVQVNLETDQIDDYIVKNHILSESKVAHIVLYVSPYGKANDAHQISSWTEISTDSTLTNDEFFFEESEQIFLIQGVIQEKWVTGIRRIPNTVSVCPDCVTINSCEQQDTENNGRRRPKIRTCHQHTQTSRPNSFIYRMPSSSTGLSSSPSRIDELGKSQPRLQGYTLPRWVKPMIIKHHPTFAAPHLAVALGMVQDWMDRSFLDPTNKALVEWFVNTLDVEEVLKQCSKTVDENIREELT
ncbi:hypothetical protein HK096_009223 [Nowakowskiella sp. JEL0078]|nr:hypothetical protein HK096_009223 [Nowakowskiella sp. JEL0078]